MAKFFATQKLDEAGIVGITLQKLLIFFMVLDVALWFFGCDFFTAFLSLLFHFAVFMGVYRRRTAVLLLYVVFHVVAFVLAAFAIILAVSALMYVTPEGYDDSSAYPEPRNISHYHNIKNYFFASAPVAYRPNNHTNNHTYPTGSPAPNHPTAPHPPHTHSFGDSSSDEYMVDTEVTFVFGIVMLLFSVVVLYCKILSVVLAHRMRKLLLASAAQPILPVARPVELNEVHDGEPTYVPADLDNMPMPIFTQPGFAYQPMMQQNPYAGQSPMMPAPFMYGQHPVFYSYGPAPADNNNNNNNKNEKL